MDGQDPADLDEELYTKLCDEVALDLRLNRLARAEASVAKLLERWADRTTAQERAGDLAIAQGKTARAREHYRRAIEIEPANADAERKFGAALLALTPDERRKSLIDAVIADPEAHRPTARRPLNAVLSALVFPGMGQLHNREQEKGLVMLGVGAVLLMMVFYVLIQVPYSIMAADGGRGLSPGEQWSAMQAALSQMSGWYLVGTVALVMAYSALYLFGIYDAWRRANADGSDLGVL